MNNEFLIRSNEQIAALHIFDQSATMVDTKIQTTVADANVPRALKHPPASQKSQPNVALNMCATSTLAVSIAIFNRAIRIFYDKQFYLVDINFKL